MSFLFEVSVYQDKMGQLSLFDSEECEFLSIFFSRIYLEIDSEITLETQASEVPPKPTRK